MVKPGAFIPFPEGATQYFHGVYDKLPNNAVPGYEDLRAILDEAYAQSAHGKGKERHANNLPWDKQPILQITRAAGVGFPVGQALKKLTEAIGMLDKGKHGAAEREILGAIVYAAAAIRYIREHSE